MQIFKRLLRWALALAFSGLLLAVVAVGVAYWLIAPRLPSVAELKNYPMQVPLRVLSADGKLIASFGETRRIPVDIGKVPDRLKHAVLSAEDADFYHHPGVDWHGIARAGWHVLVTGGDKGPGGSTITQQVARNFFLSPEKLYSRKLTEIFIALRIEHELSKDQILELYLNKMFLGHRSYGVAAAAEYYYGKTLDQLTVAECALIASTFQLPSAVNPINSPKRAIARRNWVLGEMLRHDYITKAVYEQAIAEPNRAYPHEQPIEVDAPYLAEMVRRQVLDRFGNDALTEGYVVRTTLQSGRQQAAVEALRDGLIAYDRRHGWRGPEAHQELPAGAGEAELDSLLSAYTSVSGMQPGIVTASDAKQATVYLSNRESVILDLATVSWARPHINDDRVGAAPSRVDGVLKRGDIIRLARDDKGEWQLAQIPAAQAALASVAPEDGSIQALVGGFNFVRSKFNRAVMAARQPGSSFKPYLYSAAFERGFTPASIINDAPLALPDPSRPNGIWTPSNDDDKFAGPMRLREALVQSKNLVSVRLLDAVGVRYMREYATRFGFSQDAMPANLSMALGTASVSPMGMARGYAVFANGGYLVTPYFIHEIDDRNGQPVYVANPARACRNCQERLLDTRPPGPPPAGMNPAPANSLASASSTAPAGSGSVDGVGDAVLPADAHGEGAHPPVLAPGVIEARNDYLVTSLMKDVILRGTGSAARALERDDLAGKTGSTNDHRDAWFVGFDGELSTAVWVGFDDYSSLGRGEFGAKAALPIWMSYMGSVLKGQPSSTLPMPPGISTVWINRYSGLPTATSDPDGINEIFRVEDVDRLRSQAAQQKEQDQQHAYDIF
ncbi:MULTISPECIES: penicillin-binding protein 1A [Rhodanobacter]|uniref:penicillin-binding protein 1A n=1 Tax=Rhodanobacter TaxID=75309 RepID=UPI0004234430|nr:MULTISPECIES: penicillin-binding protein 1A [Rhodanobacter]TAN18547.1 MAG: penicillin-binding protein 1A [Rhodanobacter sp.]UJJ54567.1 penicillin-binding protein 1A [Rhodanobacter thiooxydans]